MTEDSARLVLFTSYVYEKNYIGLWLGFWNDEKLVKITAATIATAITMVTAATSMLTTARTTISASTSTLTTATTMTTVARTMISDNRCHCSDNSSKEQQ